MTKRKYDYLGDDWITPAHRKFRLMCCDCHLVHVIDFRIGDGVELRMSRDDRATAAARRPFRFSERK